jgi:hypothetical protein
MAACSPTTALQDPANDLLLSAATVWELAIKIGLGKLTLSLPYRGWMAKAITDLDLTLLPITVEYAERQAGLPPHHKDPFDRLISSLRHWLRGCRWSVPTPPLTLMGSAVSGKPGPLYPQARTELQECGVAESR